VPTEPLTLIVFADARQAAYAGFDTRTANYPADPNLRAWWPTRGLQAIQGWQFGRIFFTRDVHMPAEMRGQLLARCRVAPATVICL
jgi:hypothetical protein